MKKIDVNNYSENTSIVKLSFHYKAPPSIMPKITTSKDAYEIFRSIWSHKNNIDFIESAHILLLNRANKVHGSFELSTGGVGGTIMDISMIAQAVLLSSSSGFLLCHSHPSGNIKPSKIDIDVTQQIKEAMKLFDITLLDHIILTSETFYSFADQGML